MTVYIVIGIIVITFILLGYVDNKTNYDNIPIFKHTKDNGEYYFSIPYYIWQENKKSKAIEMYSQNTILDFNGYKYEITNFGGYFLGSLFIERELRFWGNPLQTNRNTQLTINQYGTGNIHVELNNNEYINHFINIQEYISQDMYIDRVDKEIMQNLLRKILNEENIGKKEFDGAYEVFLKYEPLLSFAVDVLSSIKDSFIE